MIQQGEEEAYHHRVHVEGENVALQSLSWFPGRFPTEVAGGPSVTTKKLHSFL